MGRVETRLRQRTLMKARQDLSPSDAVISGPRLRGHTPAKGCPSETRHNDSAPAGAAVVLGPQEGHCPSHLRILKLVGAPSTPPHNRT